MHSLSLKKIIIVLGILIVALFGVYYLVYRDIAHKNEHISSLLSGLSLENGKQEYLATTTAFLDSIAPDVANIKNSILSSDGDVKFIEDIERIARADGLSINIDSLSFQEDPVATANGVVVLNLKAKTTGSWAATYTFLKQIESLPLKVKVKSFGLSDTIGDISIDASEPPKPTDKWQSSFEINVLKYK